MSARVSACTAGLRTGCLPCNSSYHHSNNVRVESLSRRQAVSTQLPCSNFPNRRVLGNRERRRRAACDGDVRRWRSVVIHSSLKTWSCHQGARYSIKKKLKTSRSGRSMSSTPSLVNDISLVVVIQGRYKVGTRSVQSRRIKEHVTRKVLREDKMHPPFHTGTTQLFESPLHVLCTVKTDRSPYKLKVHKQTPLQTMKGLGNQYPPSRSTSAEESIPSTILSGGAASSTSSAGATTLKFMRMEPS